MEQNVMAIQLDGLSKTYRRSHLGRVKTSRGVDGITLSVREGEVFGLLGLNGSGKTTTIKLLLGLLFPTAGHSRVFGAESGSPEAKRLVGFLPEIPYFYKYLSGREVLRFYGRLSGLPENRLTARIDEVIAQVRMTGNAGRSMREYSKGMLQRIALAQSMIHDPKLMVLDEPVTGLDPLGLREMRELIQGLNQKGKTIFFSSHSISEVEKLCHRVGILVEGRLARVVDHAEWGSAHGKLEEIFVSTVDPESVKAPV
ncbi:MAG: ABC transporter ATP-binding protein [Elusimicrobia bacterium]|jgi:ABC-2 type transport system ATP-binding protein|nr:ABC transporter ATP-binding protein [Elusimicrobiota bacterium]